jgi:hypothetical protein
MTRWLGSGAIIRLGLCVILIRMVTSEQSTGAVGFLQMLNMGSEQMRPLYWVMLLGAVAGLASSALTISPKHLIIPLFVSLLAMATGAFMDSHSSNLTRPAQMYLSQFLLAFGSTFFLGPSMALGISHVRANPRNLVSFSVLFGICNNLGGLIGAALLGTFQTWREKFHSNHLVDRLSFMEPLVSARVQSGGAGYARVLADPALRSEAGLRALANAATREANVMAYNDVFMLIGSIAVLTMVWITLRGSWLWYVSRQAASPDATSGTASQ